MLSAQSPGRKEEELSETRRRFLGKKIDKTRLAPLAGEDGKKKHRGRKPREATGVKGTKLWREFSRAEGRAWDLYEEGREIAITGGK